MDFDIEPDSSISMDMEWLFRVNDREILDFDVESNFRSEEDGRSFPSENLNTAVGNGDLTRTEGERNQDKGQSENGKQKHLKATKDIPDHIQIMLEDPPIVYQCKVCKKMIKTKGTFRYHGKQFCGLKGEEKPIKCEVCGAGFCAMRNYKLHLQRLHNVVRSPPHICSKCGMGFQQSKTLDNHMRRHIIREQHFSCRECNKSFGSYEELESHNRIHSDKRRFACFYCSKGFERSSNLQIHLRTHTDERPFGCPHCGRRFTSKGLLDKHLKMHSQDYRPYPCDQCSRRFPNGDMLQRHLEAHSAKQNFLCFCCGATYRHRVTLNRHIRQKHPQPEDGGQLGNVEMALSIIH